MYGVAARNTVAVVIVVAIVAIAVFVCRTEWMFVLAIKRCGSDAKKGVYHLHKIKVKGQ